MSEQMVAIKGIKDGLLIALNESEDWQLIMNDLASRLDAQSNFFTGAKITLEVGARPVRKHELNSFKTLLERRGLSLALVNSESPTTIEAATELDLRAHYHGQSNSVEGELTADDLLPSSEEEGTPGVMIRRTMRSGRSIHSQGHVIVYGDVNPGAEIIADGDVIIWGRLRGIVHAGANGNEEAIVCALDMIPTQLRIAGFITVSPPEKNHKAQPEIAFVRDGQIEVEAWK